MKKLKNVNVIGYVILISIILVLTYLMHLDKKDEKTNIVYLDNELHYWETKAKIIKEITLFMNNKVPIHNISPILIVKYSDKYDVDIRMFLTQGLLESHYGTKGLARKTHSVCNVGAWDDGTITHRYDHPNESIEPYFKLIKEQYLVDKTEEGLLKNFVNIEGNRYASYPYYERELTEYWNNINNITKLDSLIEVYRYYKIELNR